MASERISTDTLKIRDSVEDLDLNKKDSHEMPDKNN